MTRTMTFGDVMEAVDTLTWEEQECLLETLQRQLAEKRREQIAQDVQEASTEFRSGKCRPATGDKLFAEIAA